MKSLRESLLDDDLIDKPDKMIKDEIKSFLKANYKGVSSCKISREPNIDGKYEVSSTKDVDVISKKITSLTNGMFIWTIVDGYFRVVSCNSLKSLEGAPKEVGGHFYCFNCNSLTSLKGAPKEIGGGFYCDSSKSLKSLEGAPKEVGGDFNCIYCNSLESLKGAPKKVGEDFSCINCESLKSLEGAPKEVGGDFSCYGCASKFTEDDVRKISIVKGEIKC